jgi:uncharacterized membrane protein
MLSDQISLLLQVVFFLLERIGILCCLLQQITYLLESLKLAFQLYRSVKYCSTYLR